MYFWKYILAKKAGLSQQKCNMALYGLPVLPIAEAFEKTLTGNPITISDALAKPAVSLKVFLEPKQDLNGYDHPWPAGGGKNLIAPIDRSFVNNGVSCLCSASAETVSLKGTATGSGGRYMKMKQDIVLPAGNYVLSKTAISGKSQASYIVNRTDDDAYISGFRFSLEEETSVYVGANVLDKTVYDEVVHLQIETGNTATAWAPYSNICPISGWGEVSVNHSATSADTPTEYEVEFTQQGTVYGGTVDIVSGVLSVTWAILSNPQNLNWISNSSQGMKNFQTASGTVSKKNGSNNWKCSRYSNGFIGTDKSEGIFIFDSGEVCIRDYRYWEHGGTSAEEAAFKTSLADVTIAYELATPQTYNLTPEQVTMLLGNNYLSTEDGTITLTYMAGK